MKKIGLWMAALTAVTVGGVYATWNYAESNNISKVEQEKAIALAPAHQDGEIGSYAVVPSVDYGMWIESSGSMNPNDSEKHKAVFVMTGSITILFTPKDVASVDVKTNGIETKFEFSLSGGVDSWTYDSDFDATNGNDATKIVKNGGFNSYSTIIHPMDYEEDGAKWTDSNNDGTFEYVIDTGYTRTVANDGTYALELKDNGNGGQVTPAYQDLIQFNNIVLDTYAKYEAFVAALTGKTVVLTVNDTTGLEEEQNA